MSAILHNLSRASPVDYNTTMTETRRFAIVITSIFPPTEAVAAIANANHDNQFDFIVAGDSKSPRDFDIKNCIYYTIDQQRKSEFKLGSLCPAGHYARKNLGYLLAIARQCNFLIETDDDNIPLPAFWDEPQQFVQSKLCQDLSWVNVYRYFTEVNIWPRGLPLNAIHSPPTEIVGPGERLNCPIQQGLADGNPDVDAIYRLVCDLPQFFQQGRRIALGKGSWCPFNSQNTIWFPDAFLLLYLPAYCSFRMTDIWRSLIAQRIGWVNNWQVLFSSPTVHQKRNEHDLLKDFKDEIDGYLHNDTIAQSLMKLELSPGIENIPDNMNRCYRQLVDLDLIDVQEMNLLDAWINDLTGIRPSPPSAT